MPAINITPPNVEPLTLVQAKAHLREVLVDVDNDALITQAIKGAREVAENDCRRAFITQHWRFALDEFPRPSSNTSSATWYGPQWGTAPGPLVVLKPDGTTGYEIWLPFPPLQTVESITYVDQQLGTVLTLDPALYIVDKISEPGRIMPAYGTTWPLTQIQPNAVLIDFTCGYGDTATTVPACVKQWMLLQLGVAYENRELEILAGRGTIQHFPFADRLLDPIRVRRY